MPTHGRPGRGFDPLLPFGKNHQHVTVRLLDLENVENNQWSSPRFPDWQQTSAGKREVKGALCKTWLKYQLHQDKELFEKAYGYVVQYH